MKLHYFIYLPDGKTFKIGNPVTDLSEEKAKEEITSYRRLMSTSNSVEFPTLVNGKREYIVLWGDTLKNSYMQVKIEE